MWIRRHLGAAVCAAVLALVITSAPALAQAQGRIEGRITRPNGQGIGGVAVVVEGVGLATLTDNLGTYSFDHVPVGTHTLTFTQGEKTESEEVVVEANATTEVSTVVDWQVSFVDTITVFSASRQTERITEAPASVTLIPEEQIERQAASGQVPKLLEFTPGAEVTQSGLYDFNFNTRGFNSSLNRRILTLIDGRDPSVPFLGSQEWAAVSFPVDDLASVELVRGPGSALYGADAFNGVLNMVTKPPRYSQGGRVQITGGELSTNRADLRWATEVGGGWYFKLTGGYLDGDDFTESRNPASGGPEYRPCTGPGQTDCLEPEVVPLFADDVQLSFGGARFDKYFSGGQVFTIEGGTASIEGPVAVTGIGRVQLLDVERPWARANFNTTHWNVLGYYNARDASDQRSLRSGGLLVLDTENYQLEVQGNTNFADGRGRIIGGAYAKEEELDTAAPNGQQTLMFSPKDESFEGFFAQLDWSFTDKLKAVVAGRWDDSSLHDSEVSPRASLVYSVTPNHTLRGSFSEAFQVPNYSEFFLQAAVAPPVNLSPFEAICAQFGVSCGFDRPVPILALGNPTLEVEEVEAIEIGYSGVVKNRAFITFDVYQNDYDNFVTDLIIRLNSTLGDINPEFNFYTPPADLPAPAAAALLGALQANLPPTLFPFLTNAPNGDPVFGLLSYVNFGAAEAEGAEFGLNYYISDEWVFDANASWFDFTVDQQLAEDPVLANTGEWKYGLGISYLGDRFDASLKWRYSDGFDWNAGVFRGPVPAYDLASVTANYHFNDSWLVGIDVSNVFDNEDYQSFGGDLVGRRALVRLSYGW